MKLVKTFVLSVFLSLGIPQAHAGQTNIVQNLSIQLWGVQSGGSETNRVVVTSGFSRARIDTRQIIQALGAATGNSFAPRAKLVVVTPMAGGESAIQVRDGSNIVYVTDFFLHQQVSDAVSGSQSNSMSHRSVALDYSVQRFALHDAEGFPALSVHFDVRGFASEITPATRTIGNLQMGAAGSGDVGGNLTILHGDIEVQGDRLEVVTEAPVS